MWRGKKTNKRKVILINFLSLLNHILKKEKNNNNHSNPHSSFPPAPHHTWIHCSQTTNGSAVILTAPIVTLRQKQSPKQAEDWPQALSAVSTSCTVNTNIPKPMGCTPPCSPHPTFCCPEEKPEIKIHTQKETEPSGKLHTWKAGCAHSLATACSLLAMWKILRALLFC